MVVEELIAKLGFRVTGADQIKKFDDVLKKTAKGIENFGKAANEAFTGGKPSALANPLKQATAEINRMSSPLGKLKGLFQSFGQMATGAAAHVGRVSTTLAQLGIGTGVLVGGIGAITLGLLKMASAAAIAAAQTAKLRREAQIKAFGARTTAGHKDSFRAGFRAQGLSNDDADQMISSIAEKANTSIRDDGNGGDLTKKWGIAIMDKENNQRDSAAVGQDVIAKFLGMNEAAFRAKDLAARSSGKAKRSALRTKDLNERNMRRLANDAGISDDMVGTAIAERWTQKEYAAKQKERNRINPPLNSDQEARMKRVASGASELSDKLSALGGAFDNIKAIGLDNIIGPLNGFASAIINIAKAVGIVNTTREEASQKAESDRETQRGFARTRQNSPGVDDALKKADATEAVPLLRGIFGDAASKAAAELKGKADHYRNTKARYDEMAPKESYAKQDQMREHLQQIAAELTAAAARAEAAGKPDPQKVIGPQKPSEAGGTSQAEAIRTLLQMKAEIDARNSPAAVAKDAQAKVENDQRKYENIGNDQRTISVSTTVNQTVSGTSAPAAAGAAVSGAASAAVSKASNASTGAAAAP